MFQLVCLGVVCKLSVAAGRVASDAEAVAILPLIGICVYMIFSSLKKD